MKYRVKFSKIGPIKYIGHLDVMRYFQKAIRRANIPVAYSEGFSPHQILSFAFPLSVGFTSEGEYFDIELTDEVNCCEIRERLNGVMSEGIKVIDVKALDEKSINCMSAVFAASYRVTIKDDISLPDNYIDIFNDYFSQETIVVNKPKKKGGGFIEINLKQFLYNYSIDGRVLEFTVNASSSDNIRPGFVIDMYYEALGISPRDNSYNVHRLDLFGNISLDENEIKLCSLIDI